MPLTPIQLPIRSNRTRSGFEGDAALVNAYVEDLGTDSKNRFAVYSMPGFSDFATLSGVGKVRAMLAIGAKLYVVSDRVVSVVDASGTETVLGGFATDGPAYMGRNRRDPPQIGIVSEGLFKVIDTGTDTLSDINIAGLPPPFSFAVVDGYGILPGPGHTWHITTADDFTSVNLLDFASAESNPDPNVRVIAFQNAAWFLGERSTENWRNTGASFPFARLTQAPIGCKAAGSAAIADDKLIWVADDNTVKMTAGSYTPETISTNGVSRAIENETSPSEMTATTFSFHGHHFYVLNGSTFSYQFDVTTGSWTERKSYGLDRWRIDTMVEFDGKWIAGDFANGKLYEMSPNTYDEAGTAMVTEIHFPPVHAWPKGLIFDAFYLDIMPGVGLNSTDLANLEPKIMLDYSDDGGRSWSTQRQLSVGKLGQTQVRAKATRLGSLRRNQRTFRVSYSADTRFGVFGAAVQARPLRT